jgi:hypothetical protein
MSRLLQGWWCRALQLCTTERSCCCALFPAAAFGFETEAALAFFCVMNTTQSLPRTAMDVTPHCRTALKAYSAGVVGWVVVVVVQAQHRSGSRGVLCKGM